MGKYIDGSGLSHFMGIIKGALAGKSDTSHTHSNYVSDVKYDTTSRKLQQSKNGGSYSDIVTLSAIATSGSASDLGSGTIPFARIPTGATSSTVAVGNHTHSSYVNQNAFGNVKVGSTTVAADTATDTLELVAGNGVGLTADANGDSVTVKVVADSDCGFAFDDDGTLLVKTVGSDNNGVMTPALLTKLNGIATGAEVNQNAFSNVKVGSTTVAADAKTDTLELVAGTNVTLTPDADNDKVTIAATDTTALGSMTGTLGVGHGGTGVSTLGAGVVYHSASGTGALSIATAANIVSAIGNTAVNRATNDASGNKIETTYAKLASPALTGTPTAPTAAAGTNTTQIATTAFVTNAVGTATAGALQYKGTATKESDISGQAYKKGWYYVVSTAGTYLGKVCEVGDMLIAKQDKSSTPANDWDAIQSNIEVLSNSEIDALWAAA